MLHGAIVWLVATPMILALASHGAGNYMGHWYSGLSPNHPAWAEPKALPDSVANSVDPEMVRHRTELELNAAKATRNAALGAVAALLLGLMGAVVGGWMASGEPMTFTHWHHREGNAVLRG